MLYLLAKYAGLTVNGQTQFIMTVLVIGAGTDYALLLVARYREELRRHEDRHEAMAFALHRAAPAILASAATVVVGLCACVRRPQLDRGPRPGQRRRRRGDRAGHGHPAAGAAGDLRPLDVLAVQPDFGSAEPTQSGLLGARRRPDQRAPAPVWIVTAVRARCRVPRACSGSTPTACPPTTASRDARLGHGPELLADHGLADNSNTIQVVANADQCRRSRSRSPASTASGAHRPDLAR